MSGAPSAWVASRGTALAGRVGVPGDKSVSHRAVMLGALADGVTDIHGFLEGEDTRATARIFSRSTSLLCCIRVRNSPTGRFWASGNAPSGVTSQGTSTTASPGSPGTAASAAGPVGDTVELGTLRIYCALPPP